MIFVRWLRTVVFSNPFDSFHNTVAEAKEERERLDRLLTVSTPRERLLVAVIALFLLLLAAWLYFGSVPRSLAVDGVLVGAGQESPEGSRSVQALVWLQSDLAPAIMPGMPAAIELVHADGETGILDGEVAATTAVPAFEQLPALQVAAPVSVHRIEITLDEGSDLAPLADVECRIVVELGKHSPIALFGMKRP